MLYLRLFTVELFLALFGRGFLSALFCTASSACFFARLLSRALSRGHLTSYMNSFAWMSSMGFFAGPSSFPSSTGSPLQALSQGFHRGLLPWVIFRELFGMHGFQGFFREGLFCALFSSGFLRAFFCGGLLRAFNWK